MAGTHAYIHKISVTIILKKVPQEDLIWWPKDKNITFG